MCFSSTWEGFIVRIAFRSDDFILWITKHINISWTIIQLWKAKVKEYCWLLILWSTNQIFEIILATSFVQFLNIVLTKEHFRWKFQSFYSFQSSVAFYIETSHLFWFLYEMQCCYILHFPASSFSLQFTTYSIVSLDLSENCRLSFFSCQKIGVS